MFRTFLIHFALKNMFSFQIYCRRMKKLWQQPPTNIPFSHFKQKHENDKFYRRISALLLWFQACKWRMFGVIFMNFMRFSMSLCYIFLPCRINLTKKYEIKLFFLKINIILEIISSFVCVLWVYFWNGHERTDIIKALATYFIAKWCRSLLILFLFIA